jgi:hypothetical protein
MPKNTNIEESDINLESFLIQQSKFIENLEESENQSDTHTPYFIDTFDTRD